MGGRLTTGSPAPTALTETGAAAAMPLRGGDWWVVGASVRGSAHEHGDGPLQDAHAWAATDDGFVIAVADGAGSAARSDVGAAAAVAAAVAAPDDPVAAARRAIEAIGGDLGELACTLLVAVVAADGVRLHAVGDGAAVVADADGRLVVPLPPDRGEFRNETVFVTSDGWEQAIRTASVPSADVTGLALLTDGLELLALDVASGTPHPPFFAPLLQFAAAGGAAAELVAFVGSERVRTRTDDDCTLVLAVPRCADP
jgi:hypothetical protein